MQAAALAARQPVALASGKWNTSTDVFGPLASVLVVLLLSHGLTSLALFLLPLVAGLALELVLRRTGR